VTVAPPCAHRCGLVWQFIGELARRATDGGRCERYALALSDWRGRPEACSCSLSWRDVCCTLLQQQHETRSARRPQRDA